MRILAIAAALSLTACLAHPPPPPPPPPPEAAAAGTAVLADSVYAGRLDRYVGRYTYGARSLSIRRSGATLVAAVAPPPAPPQFLRTIGEATFVDDSGTSYLFMLPPDGPGAMLHTQRAGQPLLVWRRFP